MLLCDIIPQRKAVGQTALRLRKFRFPVSVWPKGREFSRPATRGFGRPALSPFASASHTKESGLRSHPIQAEGQVEMLPLIQCLGAKNKGGPADPEPLCRPGNAQSCVSFNHGTRRLQAFFGTYILDYRPGMTYVCCESADDQATGSPTMSRNAPGKHYREGISLLQMFKMFPDEMSAERWFEELRWGRDGENPRCPRCGSSERTRSRASRKPMPWYCGSCSKYFSVRTGTCMEESRLPLQK